MKKILVPTDFSENSVLALSYAIEIAKSMEAEIQVLHILSSKSVGSLLPVAKKEQKRNAEKQMENLMNRIQFHAGNLSIEPQFFEGKASSQIVLAAEHADIDLIVMGTAGAGGLKGLLLGSTTSAVMEETRKPLLVIPQDCRPEGFEKIVLAIDNNPPETLEEVNMPVKFVKEFGTYPEIIHFGNELDNPDDLEAKLGFLDAFDNYSISYAYGKNNKAIEEKIQDFAALKKADLICMIRQDKDIWDRLLTGSNTRKQVLHSDIPLLILHKIQIPEPII